jgi:hypothetical protein
VSGRKLITSLALLAAACTDGGETATPAARRATPIDVPPPRPPLTPASPAPTLALVSPPFDVVSTHGAIDSWPRLVPGVDTRAFTSHDRAGGNDDGFGGTYSALYVNERGEHVIFDAGGPGVLRTLWFTSPVDGNGPLVVKKVRFYFDDEASPPPGTVS